MELLNISWNAQYRDAEGKEQLVHPEDMFSHEQRGNTECWRGHAELGGDFEIRLTEEKEGTLTVGQIRFSGDNGRVEELHYPVAELTFDSTIDLLYAGADTGFILRNSTARCQDSDKVSLIGVPVFALTGKNEGFYFDTRRRTFRMTCARYDFNPDRSRITVRMCHPVHQSIDAYDAAYGPFSGRWFDAAMIYRSWRKKHPLYPKRTSENPLRDIDLWVWNRGRIADVIPPVLALHQANPELKIALNWYWWHSNPYDTGYPDFWPPREGEEAFRKTVRILHKNNIYVQVYINGFCWDMDGESWQQGGTESVMMNAQGEPVNHAFNRYNHHRLGYMCGEAPKFQDRLSRLVRTLHDSGLDGQYLDMISNMGVYHCYNPLHRHHRGDAQTMVYGYRALLKRLHEENLGYPLLSEGCGENYLDVLDGITVCNTISGEHQGKAWMIPVPFFPAVYHGECALFGGYASPTGIPPWDVMWPAADRWQEEQPWHRLYPEQFYIELYRCFVYGTQPTVCEFLETVLTNPELAEARRVILYAADFYRRHKEFLFDGAMLSPEGFECAEHTVLFHGRMIFTKPAEDKRIESIQPSVLHSVWQSPQGGKALFLANYTEQEQRWKYGEKSGTLAAHELRMIPL